VRVISVGLLGLGTVGTGVVQLLQNHQDKLIHQTGCPIAIKRILVQDLEKERSIDKSGFLLTTKIEDVLDDPEIDLLI